MRYGNTCPGLLLLFVLLADIPVKAQTLAVINAQDPVIQFESAKLRGPFDQPTIQQTGFATPPAWDGCIPGWYGRGEAIFMQRSRAGSRVITVDDRGTFQNAAELADDVPLITTDDLEFDEYEAGFRVALGRALGNGLALEGSVFSITGWDSRAEFTSNGLLGNQIIGDALSPPFVEPSQLVLNVENFFHALNHQAISHSELTSAEMNVKATWRFHNFIVSELAGVRYLRFEDDFTLISQDDRLSTPAAGIGRYDIQTKNDLIGGQYGGEAIVPIFGGFYLSTAIKGGVYVNSPEQESHVVNNGVFVVQTRAEDENIAFIGELNVSANFKLTNHLSVRGGYDFLWVEGLALAPEQYTFDPAAFDDLNNNGGIFAHGFRVGLQFER